MDRTGLSKVPTSAIMVSEFATLEEIIPELAGAKSGCCVTDADGNVVGRITSETVVDALAAGDTA